MGRKIMCLGMAVIAAFWLALGAVRGQENPEGQADAFGALFQKGEAELGQMQFAQALQTFQQAQRLKPDDPVVQNRLGRALASLERYTEAIAAYQRSNAVMETVDNHLGMMLAYASLRDIPNALAQARRWAEMDRRNGQAQATVGNWLTALGRHEEAIAAFKKAESIQEAPSNLNAIADCYMAMKEYDQAENYLKKMLKRFPDSAYLVHQGRSRIAADQGDAAAAETEMENALAAAPAENQPGLKAELAPFALARGDYQKAYYLLGKKPYLGISFEKAAIGMRVVSVAKNGPADLAGIRVGDTVVEFEGEPLADVPTAKFANEMVGRSLHGGTIRLKTERGGRYFDIRVVAGVTPDLPRLAEEARSGKKARGPEALSGQGQAGKANATAPQAAREAQGAQIKSAPPKPALVISDASVTPGRVRAGGDFVLGLRFTLSLPNAGEGEVPVTLTLTFLRDGRTAGEIGPESLRARSNKAVKLEKPLTAAPDKGRYSLRIRLTAAGISADKVVEFTIE